MEYVTIVIMLALLEYMFFGFLVGQARNKHGVSAPAVTGHPVFERSYRVHQNTLEQLIVFIPAITAYGYYGNPIYAAAVGVLFLVGRLVYLVLYLKDPKSRMLGFLMTFVAVITLIVAALVSVLNRLFLG